MTPNEPVRVLHLIYSFEFGGSQRTLLSLWRHRQPQLVDYAFCSLTDDGPIGLALRGLGAPTSTLAKRRGFDPGTAFKIRALLKDIRPDILHAHELSSQFYGAAGAAMANVRHRIASFHSTIESMPAWKKSILRLTARRYDALHTVGEAVRRSLFDDHFEERKILCIRNGIVLQDFPPVDDGERTAAKSRLIKTNALTIGAIGRFTSKKRFDLVVETAALLKERGAEFFLLFQGDGPEKNAVRSLAERRLPRGSFLFLPADEDVQQFYSAVDVLLLPSQGEGLPQVLLEAMAMGTCVVTTRSPQTEEVVEDGETGLLVGEQESGPFADAVLTICRQPEKMRRIRSQAREKIERDFSFERTNRSYIEMYRNVARGLNPPKRTV